MIAGKIWKDWGPEVLILSFFIVVIVPYGAGITFDTVSFFQAGDHFWSTGKYTHFAADGGMEFAAHRFPLYPLIVSLFRKADPRLLVLQILLFAALIAAFKFLIKASGAPKYFLLLLLTYPFFLNHFAIWTESLYAVLFVWLMIRINKEPHFQNVWWVVGIVMLLCLTRMVGIVAAGSLLVVYLLDKRPLHGWLVFASGAGIIAAWTMMGSFYLGETARVMQYHAVNGSQLRHLAVELGAWLTPASNEWIPFVTGCAILMIPKVLAVSAWRNRREAGSLFWFLVVHFYAYLLFLIGCKMYLDASIPFESRTLYPVLLNFLGILIVMQKGNIVKQKIMQRIRFGVPLVIFLVMVMNAPAIWLLRKNGLGYNSKKWQEYPFIRELNKLDAERIYTNDQAAVYLYAPRVRKPILLPQKTDLYSKLKNPDYASEIERMEKDLSGARPEAFIVWIRNGITANVYPTYDELKKNNLLEVVYDDWSCLILRNAR